MHGVHISITDIRLEQGLIRIRAFQREISGNVPAGNVDYAAYGPDGILVRAGRFESPMMRRGDTYEMTLDLRPEPAVPS